MKIQTRLIGGLFTAATMFATPAMAQMSGNQMDHGTMSHGTAPGKMDHKGHDMKMGDADHQKMTACRAMSHADAMKDAGCAAIMKAHPDMMHKAPPNKTM